MIRHFLILLLSISAHFVYADTDDFINEVDHLSNTMATSLDDDDHIRTYEHIIQSLSSSGDTITLTDGMTFQITWWSQFSSQYWKPGDRVYIEYDFYYNQYKIDHDASKGTAWGSMTKRPTKLPYIVSKETNINSHEWNSRITLSNDYTFESLRHGAFDNDWVVHHNVNILANKSGIYQLHNLDNYYILDAQIVKEKTSKKKQSEFNDILGLEYRLNQKVLQQPDATKAVGTSLLIYSVGLKQKEKPVGVFLFIGPSGVGKTELAKALAKDLFGSTNALLRFDMSHFSEPHSTSRLIGSPPGYVNHEEGGQLSNPLLDNPQRIVLLDELEKAHVQVHKFFLPIFDEGFFLNNKNTRVDCSDAIFIMTSNLCANKIANMFREGYSPEEILEEIEPDLMDALSPELYNRVQPVVFQPLAKGTMNALVSLMLNNLADWVEEEKNIEISFDDSLKEYLMEKGYHPLLGARPLKKLIESKVILTLSIAMLQGDVEEGDSILLWYNEADESVNIEKY